jgi:hypothetical protein
MIGVLKFRGVPVLWVGLPVVRGPKATADTLFLDSLYRDAAGRATTPDANALPNQPTPRLLAGPIVPLVAYSVGTEQLLGGPGSRPDTTDAQAVRVFVKGEPLTAPAGRADDFAWPRREIGREPAMGDAPVASASPLDANARAPAEPFKLKRPRR